MSKYANWGKDGVNGEPSSMDVLLEWLATPGNVERWLVSAGQKSFVAEEIYVYFLRRGITHRNRSSITSKLSHFVHQFGEAEEWLKLKRCSHFEVNSKTRREVLQICPYYSELAPLLRPSWTRSHSTKTDVQLGLNIKIASSDDECSAVESEDLAHQWTRSERDSLKTYTLNPKWDSDAKAGRPSSLDVVMEWLAIPGNAWRWYKSSAKHDGSQHKLGTEVYKLLLSRGITYRRIPSIKAKLAGLHRQFIQAEKCLETRAIRRCSASVDEKTEREVLRICPHYTKIAPLLQSRSSEAQIFDTTEDSKGQSRGDDSSNIREYVVQAIAKRTRSKSQSPKAKREWDSDNTSDGPTSLFLLLQWLRAPGNAKRWQQSAGREGGVRVELAKEIHGIFVSHGVRHRTVRSIGRKLNRLVQQFEEAEEWLKMKGLRHFDVSKKTECAVLRICPNYREIKPLLHHVSSSNTAATGAAKEPAYPSSSEETDPNQDDVGDAFEGEYRDEGLVNSKWNSDDVNGRPSSLNVLLKWIVTSDNAARWQEAARKADGSRLELATEIYDLLLTYGITYRTARGAESKLRALEEQFDNAESWLMRKGIRHFQDTAEAERAVLQLCPAYSTIEPVLRSAQLSTVSTTSGNKAIDIRFKPTARNLTPMLSGSKRGRNEHTQEAGGKKMMSVVALEAESDERRKFFKFELQIKRDEAVLVRARVRKELLDFGLPRSDVDRLLPL
ncbi:hypothetical protein F444_01053 [Phytophthora nicotianae P1976]|uniref:Uncharacterized protein n=1 Tax=Phytophthora nicotianae P1976 TaxID=1317066 RepID=A0A081B1Y4_PHYNI|nr:hypothetical protein F444_01053 [Phytophthora nicotianae P1976]